MNPEIYSIIEDIKKFTPRNPNPEHKADVHILVRTSQLRVLLAEEAEKSTKKIVRLTWALFGLTVALLVVAIVQTVIFK